MSSKTKGKNLTNKSPPPPTSTSEPSNHEECNRPRNHIVKDASSDYDFTYRQYGQTKQVKVHQTPEEDTWPGGALWDIGVLLAKVLVMINTPTPSSSSSAITNKNNTELHVDRLKAPGLWPKSWKESHILELGCGVGLTGLVASSLGAKLCLLTDLEVVVDKVTRPNVELNKHIFGIGQKVVAIPLCWGDQNDEHNCRKVLDDNVKSSKGPSKRKVKKGKSNTSVEESWNIGTLSDPDVILIGDVAYQHKPGAPSHFDILLSTLLKFATSSRTTIVFGTRMRMPASMDLLEMFREHFDEVVNPPVQARELDTSFDEKKLGRKSMITIHFFKRKSPQCDQ